MKETFPRDSVGTGQNLLQTGKRLEVSGPKRKPGGRDRVGRLEGGWFGDF